MYNLGFILKIMLPWGLSSPCIMSTKSLSRGVKRQGRGFDHPIPSVTEVKERAELHLYSALGLHGLFYGEFYFTLKIMKKNHIINRTNNNTVCNCIYMYTNATRCSMAQSPD
jgi:hypothetical protein